MQLTDNLKMNLPEDSDVVDISKLNANFAILDAQIPAKLSKPTNDVSGVAGQVLTKTADGSEWKDAAGEKALSFSVMLSVSGWSEGTQTVSNPKFLTSGYAYTVCPAGGNFTAYAESAIYADDVTTEGQMTFHCNKVPPANLTVNILRIETAE